MLAEGIRSLRVARKISQVELANALGVSKQSVSNWENDNIQPSIDMLIRLAAFFSVSTDRLLELDTREVLDVTGLPPETVAHLRMLIEDLRK